MSHVPASDAYVVLDGIHVAYAQAGEPLVAVQDIDLEIGAGEFVSVIGQSGCGKSTLLRIIGGLQTPTQGSVSIAGHSPREAQRQKTLGYVFQDPSLLPWRTVAQNIVLPLELQGRGAGADPAALIDLVGLSAFRDFYPYQLSGGMQQRAAIARALVTTPSLLLMDEPFGALDEISRTAMRYELLRVWRAGNERRTVVFVTHSITEAVHLSDRVVVMTPRPGRIATTLDIDLPRPRSEEIELEPAFLEYTRRLRNILQGRMAA